MQKRKMRKLKIKISTTSMLSSVTALLSVHHLRMNRLTTGFYSYLLLKSPKKSKRMLTSMTLPLMLHQAKGLINVSKTRVMSDVQLHPLHVTNEKRNKKTKMILTSKLFSTRLSHHTDQVSFQIDNKLTIAGDQSVQTLSMSTTILTQRTMKKPSNLIIAKLKFPNLKLKKHPHSKLLFWTASQQRSPTSLSKRMSITRAKKLKNHSLREMRNPRLSLTKMTGTSKMSLQANALRILKMSMMSKKKAKKVRKIKVHP